MTEYYKPENEMFDSYGVDLEIEQPSFENVNVENQVENVEEKKSIESEVSVYLETIPQNEKEVLQNICETQAEVVALINSENFAEREDARIAVLGSAFAGAPEDENEKNSLPAWKRVLSGASKGAKVVGLAVALALPLSSEAQGLGDDESPFVTNSADKLFGTSVLERLAGIRSEEKNRYIALEKEKQYLRDELNDTYEIAPRTKEEKIKFQQLEAKRDVRLAELKSQYVMFTEELMSMDLKDEQVVKYIETREAQFKVLRSKILNDYEDDIGKIFEKETRLRKAYIVKRLKKIESEQERLANKRVYNLNRRTSRHW